MLYERMGYRTEITPRPKNLGADVVAMAPDTTQPSLLISCQHVSNHAVPVGTTAIQEVVAASGVYDRSYNVNFDKIVVTNASAFNPAAVEEASANNVALIARDKLSRELESNEIFFAELYSFIK